MNYKKYVKKLMPPIMLDIYSYVRRGGYTKSYEWEYVREGWQTNDTKIKGWNDTSILNKQKDKWQEFLASVEGTKPLGVSHESNSSSNEDYASHNTIMSYAYALALASHKLDDISMLDWGGGIGHYYILSKALMPNLKIDYHCKELPLLCDYGRKIIPEAHFYDKDEECFGRSYDFVLSSSSLQYSEDWEDTLTKLANVTKSYIYITRLPVISKAKSFVVVQRPYKYGYNTEYLGWFINHEKLLKHMDSINLKLIREFLIQEKPYVHNAPEQGEYRGFLFKKER